MKGVHSILNSIQGLYSRLCCILAATETSNEILQTIATEATQLNILAAIDTMRDYEVRLVVDSDDDTWLEVRYWDAQSGALGAPLYYLPGSVVSGSPVGSISYINPNTYLAQIITELQTIDARIASVTRTPSLTRTTGSGTVAAGARRASFFNSGAADDATVLGTILKQNESITFVADGEDDILSAISYDAGTSELVIVTIV